MGRRLAIGDVQGCWHSLQHLLDVMNCSADDQLWLAGDLCNRGTGSLDVLRFCRQRQVTAVLGNHDLHLLACYFNAADANPKDTLAPVLAAPDIRDIVEWLLAQPLLVVEGDCWMAHAGRWPGFSMRDWQSLAGDTQRAWQANPEQFFRQMYGNQPSHLDDARSDTERWRFCVNASTRMRVLDADLRLNLAFKGELAERPAGSNAWFDYPRPMDGMRLGVFGHWAALGAGRPRPDLAALDSGCVWGAGLTALDLDSAEWHHVATDPRDLND